MARKPAKRTGVKYLVMCCLLAAALPAGAGDEAQAAAQPVALGRDGQAMPWLANLEDAPFVVVRYADIAMTRSLPAQSAFYSISPDVVASGYFYFFHVRSVDGQEYVAGSVANLYKLCHELGVLEEIKARNKGKEFASGVGDGLKGIGTGLGNLIIHPGQSLKSVGTRVRQTGRSLERAVGAEDKVGVDSSGTNLSHLGSGPAGKARRDLAFQFGVDVYTSNPAMQKALIDLSQLRTAGGLVTWVIPYNIGMLGYFNPVGGDERAEQLIRDYDPYELRRQVGIELEPMLGMSREDEGGALGRLLMNPNYTPRELAYIGLDFGFMREVKNLPLVAETLARASTAEEAEMLSMELRLYSFLHRREKPLQEFVPLQNLFGALGRDGVFYFMFFGDTLRPWSHSTEAFERVLSEAIAMKARGMEIWTVGDVDARMAENAARRGVVIRPNILLDKTFFPAQEQNR